jgi:hypothetical protein
MPTPLCIFHKNCLDGNGAAAIVQRRHPDCEFLPMQYSHRPPTVLGRDVYMVDFGLPVEHMRALHAQARSVTWIDHHASQLPVRQALGWGILDTTECGATLTWRTLFPDQAPPPVIAYIKDKDLWRWELPRSREIAAGLEQTFPQSRFAGILEADLDAMARIGTPLVAARAARVSTAVATGIPIQGPYGLSGVRALAVHCNQDQNDVGDRICLPTAAGGLGYDLAILYYRKGTGQWVHSLRSNRQVDCAAIGERYGGGGHPQSACYLRPEPFLQSEDCPAAQRLAKEAPLPPPAEASHAAHRPGAASTGAAPART